MADTPEGDYSEPVAAFGSQDNDGSFSQEQIADDMLQSVFGDRMAKAKQYHEMLAGRAVEWGLLGPRESERLWCRHILNCAAVEALIDPGASVVDIGSGAGLPGIPLALARPDLKVTLLESLLRRATFLQLAVDELGLTGQVDVVRARAEETTTRYDVVVARAVAPLAKLVGWCAPLTKGSILAIKGERAYEDLEDARKVLRDLRLTGSVVQLQVGSGCSETSVVVVKRA